MAFKFKLFSKNSNDKKKCICGIVQLKVSDTGGGREVVATATNFCSMHMLNGEENNKAEAAKQKSAFNFSLFFSYNCFN